MPETQHAGIALARQINPDLILLDIQLPVVDGCAVARELMRDGELRDVPIVAVSSLRQAWLSGTRLGGGAWGLYRKTDQPSDVCS